MYVVSVVRLIVVVFGIWLAEEWLAAFSGRRLLPTEVENIVSKRIEFPAPAHIVYKAYYDCVRDLVVCKPRPDRPHLNCWVTQEHCLRASMYGLVHNPVNLPTIMDIVPWTWVIILSML